jgi:hypothetical protein
VGAAVQAGNTLQQAQLDVLKEILGEMRRPKPAQQVAGAPQAKVRSSGDIPVGPISLRKPQ